MSELRDLYQEVILDHAKNPRNFGPGSEGDRRVVGHNPLCGDKLILAVRIEDDVVIEAHFQGEGCAISKASASLLTQSVKGRSVAEAERLYERFHDLVTGASAAAASEEAREELGKLAVFSGVAEYPARVKCASLPWHVLHAALQGDDITVTTE